METSIITESLQLEGLNCKDCAVSVQEGVSGLNGVETATANFGSGILKVSYDHEKVTREDLKATVENLGYRINGSSGAGGKAYSFRKDRFFITTTVGGGFLLLGLQ